MSGLTLALKLSSSLPTVVTTLSVTRDLSTARLLEADCLPEEDDDENGDKDEEDAKNEAGDGDVSCIPPQGARFCEIPFVFCKPRLQKREKVI